MGKAVYRPKGSAKEYNQWAVNFYNGCSGMCSYCCLNKGVLAKTMGGDTPVIKKTLIDEKNALVIFEKEVHENLVELKKHGLFFNFSSDPMLPETHELNLDAINICYDNGIQQIILTKQAGYTNEMFIENSPPEEVKEKLFWGATLTGHDELEPGCSTNQSRIEMLKYLSNIGILTWASIEPIIDFRSSLDMIWKTLGKCVHYKIGLESGKNHFPLGVKEFIDKVNRMVSFINAKRIKTKKKLITVYFKDSIIKAGDIDRAQLPYFCVKSTFKPWKDEPTFHA